MRYKTVTISTDSGSCDYMPDDRMSLSACLRDFFGERIGTLAKAEAYLRHVGGYGWIEVDGERLVDVPS